MLKKPLFLEMFVLLLVVGVLNYLASIYHLYWSTNEFDSGVHFLGGAALSAFFLWLYFFSGFFNPKNRSLPMFLMVAIVGSMFVAVAWEAYELILGEAVIQKAAYPYDTTLDFIMDTLGMIAVALYGHLREISFKKNES
jgi:hypothetical protein